MRQTSRDAGVIHPNSGPRRLWDFCAALVAVAMVLNPNVNVMGSAFFVADAALNPHGLCGSRRHDHPVASMAWWGSEDHAAI